MRPAARQALELAERAVPYGFRALWTSPLLRARETAEAVAAMTGLEPLEDAAPDGDRRRRLDRPSLRRGPRRSPELFDAFASADPGFAFPGGESFAEQEVRVEAALEDVMRGALPALVVCHGMVIRAAMHPRMGTAGLSFTRVAERRPRPARPAGGRRRRPRRWGRDDAS